MPSSLSNTLFPSYPSLNNQVGRQISLEREIIVISDDDSDSGYSSDESSDACIAVPPDREVIVISDDDEMESSNEDQIVSVTRDCISGCPQNVDQQCTGPSGMPLLHLRIPLAWTLDEFLLSLSRDQLMQIHRDGTFISVYEDGRRE